MWINIRYNESKPSFLLLKSYQIVINPICINFHECPSCSSETRQKLFWNGRYDEMFGITQIICWNCKLLTMFNFVTAKQQQPLQQQPITIYSTLEGMTDWSDIESSLFTVVDPSIKTMIIICHLLVTCS